MPRLISVATVRFVCLEISLPLLFFLLLLLPRLIGLYFLLLCLPRLHFVLHATLWIDTFMGMMTGYNVRNAMLVARTQYHALSVLNFAGAVAAVGVVAATPIEEALERRRQRRQLLAVANNPASSAAGNERDDYGRKKNDRAAATASVDLKKRRGVSASARFRDRHVASHADLSYGTPGADDVVNPDRWPTRATLAALARLPRRKEWVDAIRKSKDFRFHCEMCPKGLEPIRSLEAFMRNMRVLWAEAKSEDSSLEPALSSALERLALVHARLCHDAKGRGGLTSELEDVLQDVKVLTAMRKRSRAQVNMLIMVMMVMILYDTLAPDAAFSFFLLFFFKPTMRRKGNNMPPELLLLLLLLPCCHHRRRCLRFTYGGIAAAVVQ